VSVIVPISTGDGAIGEIVEALGGELDRLGRTWEIIPVFDGVRGPAWEEATRLSKARPESIRPLAFQAAFGESSCLTEGFRNARGRVILTTPQYVQVDPHEIGPMLAAIEGGEDGEGGVDFVTPWRHPRVDPMLNRVQSAAFNGIMRLILKTRFHDLNCYFRAIRREVLEELTIYGDQYRFLPVLAARAGFRVAEVRVRHLKEWGGTGFFGIGVYVRRFLDILGVFFLAKFTLKPLRFFGALGGGFLVLGGLITAALIIQNYFVGGGVFGRQMFLVSVMLLTLGVQIIGFGLVGEIIIYTQARNIREYRIERIYETGSDPDEEDSDDDPDDGEGKGDEEGDA
jgi:glycosyltransferase involved in cell wall biosynthesis